jgi:predicted  nucleic acid-binding Zn-ribbon protein
MKTRTTQENIDALKQRNDAALAELMGTTDKKRATQLKSKIKKLTSMEKNYSYHLEKAKNAKK